ncbi:SDR family NAD(P)-dependent oxidoreductase [Nonomuraea solani]|nr:SDR family NAD(P)-dependent oxidoreductase [Nonomuraea solani]
MTSTIAVVGAGPGLGRAIARRFGTAGHPVALISRNRAKLQPIADSLATEGITVRAYPADVTDGAGLTAALESAAADLGRIGVLSYSPAPNLDHSTGEMPDFAAMGFTTALETTPESVRTQVDLIVGGALTAVAAVLPGMRKEGNGALLFTTGASAILPMAVLGNAAIAQAGLRHWATSIQGDLAGEGVYVGHVSVGLPIVPGGGEGDPDAIAERWYQLAQARDTFETTIGF